MIELYLLSVIVTLVLYTVGFKMAEFVVTKSRLILVSVLSFIPILNIFSVLIHLFVVMIDNAVDGGGKVVYSFKKKEK